MILFFILLLIIPCFAIKKRTINDGEILDSRSTTCIKGVLCLYIMLHNLGLDYQGNSSIAQIICEHTGGIAVGVFFFLSAFGIIRSYQKKGNKYLIKLIFNNCIRLYVISVLINLLIYLVHFQGMFTTTDTLLRIFNLDVFNRFNRMNRHGWYISTIIVLYLIFAMIYVICSKFKTDKKFIIAGILLSLAVVAFKIIVPNIAHGGGTYTREIYMFIVGIFYATFYNQVNSFFQKYFWIGFSLCFILFWIGLFLFEGLATLAATIFVIVISQKITYTNNITYFLGKICLGIYLFLYFSTLTLQPFIYNQYLWVLLNAGFILELSVILYGIQKALSYSCLRLKNKRLSKINKKQL